MAQTAARAHVERSLRRSVHGGLVGGERLPALLCDDALERAREPSAPEPPRTTVEDAVRRLPWLDRLATLATVALGPSVLGPGRLGDVALALGVAAEPTGREGEADASTLLRAAVSAHTPPADPGLHERLDAALRRRRRAYGLLVIALVAAGVVVATLVARESRAAPSGVLQWVAVLDTAPSARALASDAAAIGEVAGPRVFTDRFGCYRGFPAGSSIDPDDWFLGVADVERDVVDRLVRRLGAAPLVIARVDQGCRP
jgi:hypothetical protein